MGFWGDSSPLVKGAIVLGVLGLIYAGLGFFMGWFPFAPNCSYFTIDDRVVGTCPAGAQCAEHAGCPENSSCNDGECVQNDRGVASN